MNLNIQDTFNKELPADSNKENTRRQVLEACFSNVTPKIPARPEVLHASEEMLEALGISKKESKNDSFKNVFSGAQVLKDTMPYAMCYGGHQFGNWAGQLGDGRAINLCEVVHNNNRWALQLKGSGATPYSRSGDGLAVLRSSIREHLCSEAMYHLGVPTTRSLSLALTGDEVLRDMLYDGNADYEKGAVVCRVAPSFIRFGNFQIFAARRDFKNLKILVDYTIKHFFPQINRNEKNDKESYLQFLQEVVNSTLDMIIHWERVGFVHGVMNTDNMSILGLTIDYGPYGWLEGFDPNWTPNTTDAQGKRYRFGNQASMAFWNLMQLANALYPLVDDAPPMEKILEEYKASYFEKHLQMMRSKLGLAKEEKTDEDIIQQLEYNLQLVETDMTIFFRNLSTILKDDTEEKALEKISFAFYNEKDIIGNVKNKWLEWLKGYLEKLNLEVFSDVERMETMNTVNPKYVLRNYMAQLAIDDANKGNHNLIDELYQLLKNPYLEQTEHEKWFAKRPEWARNKVGCSMLSCSS